MINFESKTTSYEDLVFTQAKLRTLRTIILAVGLTLGIVFSAIIMVNYSLEWGLILAVVVVVLTIGVTILFKNIYARNTTAICNAYKQAYRIPSDAMLIRLHKDNIGFVEGYNGEFEFFIYKSGDNINLVASYPLYINNFQSNMEYENLLHYDFGKMVLPCNEMTIEQSEMGCIVTMTDGSELQFDNYELLNFYIKKYK